MRKLLLLLLLCFAIGLYCDVCWEENGKVVWQGTYLDYTDLVIGLSDGSYMLMWHDADSGLQQMKMQRVSAEGENYWQQPLLLSEQELTYSRREKLIEATDGNIIAVWLELDDPTVIRCQKLDPSGNKLWGINGLSFEIDDLSPYAQHVELAAAPAGGIFIVFSGDDVKAMYLDTDGNPGTGWSNDGNTIFTNTINYHLSVIPDGYGGFALAAKEDGCNNILLQRCNIEGDFLWGADGVEITEAYGFQMQNWNTGNYMIIFKSTEGQILKATVINDEGEFLYAEPVTIATAGENYYFRYYEFCKSSDGKLIVVHEEMDNDTEEHVLIANKMEIGEEPDWGETGIILNTIDYIGADYRFHFMMNILANDTGGIYISSLAEEEAYCGIDYFHLDSEGNIITDIEPIIEFTETQGTVPNLIKNNVNRGLFWSEFDEGNENLKIQILDENDEPILPINGEIIWQVQRGNINNTSELISYGNYSAVAWSATIYGGSDVFVQVIDNETGELMFPEQGIAVSENNDLRQDNPQIIFSDDGEQICIIWEETHDDNLWLQILDMDGTRLAGENGIILEDQIHLYEIFPETLNNDFIIGWSGDSSEGRYMKVQKIVNCQPAWGDGIVLKYSSEDYYVKVKVSGEYLFWEEYQDYENFLMLTKLDENGEMVENWENIILNTSYSFSSRNQEIFSSLDGVHAFWENSGQNGINNLYAQCITDEGEIIWEDNGRLICEFENEMKSMTLDSDQLYCVYFTPEYNLELMKYDLAEDSDWEEPVIIENCGEEIETWACLGIWENVLAVYWTNENEGDVYAKFFDLEGNLVNNIPEDGLEICTAIHDQTVRSSTIDESGSSIVIWEDFRSEKKGLYIQKIMLNTLPTANNDIPDGNLVNMINYPNPFMQSTTLKCDLPRNLEDAEIVIYNIRGQKVRSLPATSNEVKWDCRNQAGNIAGSGMYFYRLQEKNIESKTGRMILLR